MLNNEEPAERLYYTTSEEFEPGQEIPIGMLERSKDAVEKNGQEWGRKDAETIFEHIRLVHYPWKPSRFRACYAFESMKMTQHHIGKISDQYHDYIYEVKIKDLTKPWHRGHWAFCSFPHQNWLRKYSLRCLATLYWGGGIVEITDIDYSFSEIVTSSKLSVVQRISTTDKNCST